MAGPYPILQNGMGSVQAIWDSGATQNHQVGTRAHLPDGRVYYYSRNSGSAALVAGNLMSSETISGDMNDLAVNTALAGATSLDVTPDGTATFGANDLAEGYVVVNSGTGLGYLYKIESHLASAAATEFTINLYDAINVAFVAATTVTLMKNPWMDTVVCPAAQTQLCVGVSLTAVGAGDTTAQFHWVQTWGVACVASGDATTTGEVVMPDSTTAGETLVATAAFQKVGVNLFTATNADTDPLFLMIAP